MTHPLPRLDIRSKEQFNHAHLPFSAHIPFEVLTQCWHELPPKGTKIHLICNSEHQESHRQFLAQHGYDAEQITTTEQLNATPTSHALANHEPLETGAQQHRLWKASPLLENHIHCITHALPSDSSSPIPVFDIGCGAGRDAIFMAQHGYQVHGIDNQPIALERLALFAQRYQVSIEGLLLDCERNIEQLQQQFARLSRSHIPCIILQNRYLHRPLFPLYHTLAKGSIIAIHTFLEGAAAFGSPKKPQYLLKNNELLEQFSSWNVLLNETHHLPDGRPLSLFIAQKD